MIEIKSADGKLSIKVEDTTTTVKTLESCATQLQTKPQLASELSFYGEALRLRAELLPQPARTVNTLTGMVEAPAKAGIDVLTCTVNELKSALTQAKQEKNNVRAEFLLRVIAVRFPDFDAKTDSVLFNKLKARATNNLEFLGECGFGINADGKVPTLQVI